MKTADLIKQAEELLNISKNGAFDCVGKSDFTDEQSETAKFLLTAGDVRFGVFARNHMQELLDRLKRYEEALRFYADSENYGYGTCDSDFDHECGEVKSDVGYKARRALEEE